MMVGHALLAFALAGGCAAALGRDDREALAVGAAAGAFAAVPDVDMTYALVGVVRSGLTSVEAAQDAFWETGLVTHRAVTHSLVVGVPAAVAFAWAGSALAGGPTDRRRAARGVAAAGFLAALVATALAASGPLGGAMMALYAAAGAGVAAVAVRRAGLDRWTLLAAALFGLLSHPFGDVFTGQPPAFLYPLSSPVVGGRVALAADPTLNLLAVFGLEVATAWLAAAVLVRLCGRRLWDHVAPKAAVGAGYAVAAVALPAPTLAVSYHFVFSVLAVGAIAAAPAVRPPAGGRLVPRFSVPDPTTAAVTALAAVTLAVGAYAVAYLLGAPALV